MTVAVPTAGAAARPDAAARRGAAARPGAAARRGAAALPVVVARHAVVALRASGAALPRAVAMIPVAAVERCNRKRVGHGRLFGSVDV